MDRRTGFMRNKNTQNVLKAAEYRKFWRGMISDVMKGFYTQKMSYANVKV